MALVGENFYVADADALLRFRYTPGAVPDAGTREVLAELPGGPRNHHWTKSLIASPDGRKLYVGVGSNSNVAEHGLEIEKERAAILEIDIASGARRIFADGLRNPVGMAWEPASGALWVAVNERDEIGSDLVPDYMTSVQDGGFYGWPWSYYGAHVDDRVQPPRPAYNGPPEAWAKYCWIWFANHHHWYYSTWTEEEWLNHFLKYVTKKTVAGTQTEVQGTGGPPTDEVEALINAMCDINIAAEGENIDPEEDLDVGGAGVEIDQMEVWEDLEESTK